MIAAGLTAGFLTAPTANANPPRIETHATPIAVMAPTGIMICTRRLPNGNWDGNSCHTTIPSYPCSQVEELCEGCGCWDVSAAIDPNSTDPNGVGKPRKKAPAKKERMPAPGPAQ
jgi:hypothetical protein